MLKSLFIKNYVLIHELEMNLAAGMNTVTGETGAGKSIMLGAVGLLLGFRADSRSLLITEEKCIIEGHFQIKGYGLESLFEQEDLDFSEMTIIRREITPSGKSRAFINDTPVLLETLKQIGEQLLDIHSQHDTLLLSKTDFQLKLIDTEASNSSLRLDYAKKYQLFKALDKELVAIQSQASELRKEHEFNLFQLEELEKLQLHLLDQHALEEELELLEHTEEIKLYLSQASTLLDGDDFGIETSVSQLKSVLAKIAGFTDRLKSFSERAQSLFIELSDLKNEVQTEEESIEYDPERAELVKQLLSDVYRLCQKHQVSDLSALKEFEKQLADKVNAVVHLDDHLNEAQKKRDHAYQQLLEVGSLLTASRKEILARFTSEGEKLLGQLSIPEAKLEIIMEDTAPGISGMDHLSILFSANRGIPPQELKKVASGGEFSRLMFTFKYMMAGKTSLPTFIFDEIDTGVSGEVAKQLGVMMKQMSAKQQVITITHLPQIAAMGQKHFFVYKQAGMSSTNSNIKELQSEERVLELAKMIAGDRPSDAALTSARELINH